MKSSVLIFASIILSLGCCKTDDVQAVAQKEQSNPVADEHEDIGRRFLHRSQANTKPKNYLSIRSPQTYPDVFEPNDCYSCVDCPSVRSNTTVKRCPYENSACIVYAELYSNQKQALYVRGCVLERGGCDDIERVHRNHESIKLIYCAECIGDRCNNNGVGRSLPDLAAGIFFVIIAPLVTKNALT